ncbi:hypothetical protein GGF31_006861 [Allomyces arbusculus]|nr:hypothetical protein GGF31_006861 [Allomyces arbusculus]
MSFLTVALASAFMLSTPLLLVDRSELCADAADAPAAVAAANAAAPMPIVDSACSSPTTDASIKAVLPSPSSKRNDSAISMSSVIGRLQPLTPAAVRALDEHDEALDMSQDDDAAALEISASPRSASPVQTSPTTYFPATLMDFGLDQPAVKRVVAPSRRGSMAVKPNVDVQEDATEYSPMLESTYVGIGIPFGI